MLRPAQQQLWSVRHAQGHSAVAVNACRDDPKAGYFRMAPLDGTRFGAVAGADSLAVEGDSIRPVAGDIQKRAFQMDPPCLIRWYTLFKDAVRRRTLLPLNATVGRAHPLTWPWS